jgi:hypothetical protein
MIESLGVDFGNVIIDHLGFGTTTEFFDSGDYNSIPPVPGAIEALSRLNQGRFRESIFVVYNATNVADQKIAGWLKFHNFCEKTGITKERVQRTTNGRDKSGICRKYNASCFVDDRLEVLGYLLGKVKLLYLFRPQSQEVEQHRLYLPYVQRASTWEELITLLL